jgi:phenylacetate-CoA ligase
MSRQIIQQFYLKSPSFIQNIFITLYGYKIKKSRYGKDFWNRLRFLNESQKWSYEKLKKYQSERLQNLIHYAYQYVPYYTTVMNSSGIKPEHIKTQEDLVKFPVINKVDIIKNYDTLQTTHPQIRKKDIVEIATSGSSGTPVRVRMSKKAYQYDYANNWRQRSWYGVKIGDRIASFAGRVIINPDINRGSFWRKNYSFNQTLFSLYHLSDETTEK